MPRFFPSRAWKQLRSNRCSSVSKGRSISSRCADRKAQESSNMFKHARATNALSSVAHSESQSSPQVAPSTSLATSLLVESSSLPPVALPFAGPSPHPMASQGLHRAPSQWQTFKINYGALCSSVVLKAAL